MCIFLNNIIVLNVMTTDTLNRFYRQVNIIIFTLNSTYHKMILASDPLRLIIKSYLDYIREISMSILTIKL